MTGPTSCTEQCWLISIVEFVHDCWWLWRAWDILSCELAKQQEFLQVIYSSICLTHAQLYKQVLRAIPSLLHKYFSGLYIPQHSENSSRCWLCEDSFSSMVRKTMHKTQQAWFVALGCVTLPSVSWRHSNYIPTCHRNLPKVTRCSLRTSGPRD